MSVVFMCMFDSASLGLYPSAVCTCTLQYVSIDIDIVYLPTVLLWAKVVKFNVTFGCLLGRRSLATLLCMSAECPYKSPHKRAGDTSRGTTSACRCSRLVLEVAQYCRGEGTEGARGGEERRREAGRMGD